MSSPNLHGKHKTSKKGTGHQQRHKVHSAAHPPSDPPLPATIKYTELRKDPVYGAEFEYEWEAGGPFNGNPTQRHVIVTSPKDWESKHIIRVKVPDLSVGAIRLHKRVAPQFLAFFKAAAVRGLAARVLTNSGGCVMRTMTKKPTVRSNHAFGAAIDLNAEWNKYAGIPAKRGTRGSLCELADLCADFGIYWGGWYSGTLDGMHFEAVSVLNNDQLRAVCKAYHVDANKLLDPEEAPFESVTQPAPIFTPAPVDNRILPRARKSEVPEEAPFEFLPQQSINPKD